MSKAILNKVTIPEAFQLQGTNSSSVFMYIAKNSNLKDMLWRINSNKSKTDLEIFKDIIDNNLSFIDDLKFNQYIFCSILKYLTTTQQETLSFTKTDGDFTLTDVFKQIALEVVKNERAERIKDQVEVYDFSSLEVIDAYKNIKIIKDEDFNAKFRKKSYRETFEQSSFSYSIYNSFKSQEELSELELLCKKHKSYLLLIDNNLAYLEKEGDRIRIFSSFGRWISDTIF